MLGYVSSQSLDIALHMDLHETTGTDNSEFRPARAARDGLDQDQWEEIPDGFYRVGDIQNPPPSFQKTIIRAVAAVTHIAPPDADGNIIGEPQQQPGVIYYAGRELGLCTGFTDTGYCTTTEVYPDSPRVDEENGILAQVAAISAGLDFLLPTPAGAGG